MACPRCHRRAPDADAFRRVWRVGQFVGISVGCRDLADGRGWVVCFCWMGSEGSVAGKKGKGEEGTRR